jgi:hypothetical protein
VPEGRIGPTQQTQGCTYGAYQQPDATGKHSAATVCDRLLGEREDQSVSQQEAPPTSVQLLGSDDLPSDILCDLQGQEKPVTSDCMGWAPSSLAHTSSPPYEECLEPQGSDCDEDVGGLASNDDLQALSDSDSWEFREEENEQATLLGVLREIEEQFLLRPPSQPLYQELQQDLLKRVLNIKRERYILPEAFQFS